MMMSIIYALVVFAISIAVSHSLSHHRDDVLVGGQVVLSPREDGVWKCPDWLVAACTAATVGIVHYYSPTE